MKGCLKTVGSIFIILFAIAILSRLTDRIFGDDQVSSLTTPIPTLKHETKAVIPTRTPTIPIIMAGELSDYLDVIQKYSTVNVQKSDGTFDARADDLKQLCLDWYFYRGKDPEKFAEVNHWLNEYHEDDVTAMLARIEKKGW